MKVPLSWLKKYVPVTLPPRELAHRLTMSGTAVEGVEEIGRVWDRDKVLVGRVLKVEQHPNADRLTLPTVDLGNGKTAQVVCGAPNVAAGQKIAFAREGAQLVSPRSGQLEKLKPANIRGVISAGMVCSALELGLGDNHEGILVLDGDAPVGMPLVDYLGDAILEIEVTPNRPDCLSLLGIAREVAALTGQRVREPDPAYPEGGPPIGQQVSIEIADPTLCGRYTASLIAGVKIGPSPRWMQDALVGAGQRPINNVVDVTNYVMLEYGQPLHAFDLDAVKERKVIVRAARPGEILETLDGERRALRPPMLTIADAADAIGLAGVMGGANSEMHEGTGSVLLESANFDPVNTRRTSAALRLSTEASYRFERGIRAELAPMALRRATQLILQLAGGQAAQGIIDLYPGRKESPVVPISRGRIQQVLGVDFQLTEVEKVLGSLGFSRSGAAEAARTPQSESLWMKVPYWRSDVLMEDDLVEEIARIVGYGKVPTKLLSTGIPPQEGQPVRELKERLRDLVVACGMRETISYALTSLDSLNKVEALDGNAQPLKIANPMSGELAYLRTSLRGSILETLAANRRTAQGEGLRLFEVGHVYLPRGEAGHGELPEEREMLVGVLSGPRFPTSWLAPQEEMDFYDAKGVLESAFSQLGLAVEYLPATDPILHPRKSARLICKDHAVGVVGEVHPRVLERFGLQGSPVAMLELNLEMLAQLPGETRRYRTTSRFPESYRDLALTVDVEIPAARLQAIIETHELVVRSTPFDVYSGKGIPKGKRSVAWRVTFQFLSGTLTAEQVDQAREAILRRLQQEAGAQLRGSEE